jgi:hypothetical protein
VSVAPRRPLGLRLLNGVGGALRAAGLPLLPLDDAALLAAAERRTGLADFDGDAFREPLRRLVAALEGEASLTVLGRLIARADLGRLLENRLRTTAERRRHPEIEAGEVRRPIVIVGLPRTGTTILHALLARDPANRVPLTWEVMHPWPPPARETHDTDPRIARVEAHFAGVDRLLPGFKAMHPMGARLPQECVALTAHDFASLLFATTHRIPSYDAWLDGADLRWVYASHRRQLQYLQWRCPAARWVLKSPGHLWALDALLAEYPDARLVQTHRDPVAVVASLASLVTVLRGMASDRTDAAEIGAEWTTRLARGLARSMAVRDRSLPPTAAVFDVQFAELMRDEIGMVRRLYAHFDLPLSDEVEARMRRFLAAHPRDEHGRHRYTLAAAGLDPDVERRRYAAYQARFDVPSGP